MRSRIKVLIVDDSAVVRQVLTAVLGQDPGVEVLGAAADPLFAIERMKHGWPDVIVLDVEMPRMDGITFLKKIMLEHPTPVVICSSLTEKGAATTMQALAAGAVGIVAKPGMGLRRFQMEEAAAELLHAVKAAALADLRKFRPPAHAAPLHPAHHHPAPQAAPLFQPGPKLSADAILRAPAAPMLETTERVVAIGTSTGGTQALEQVLTALPRVAPGIVIVQHMPEKFTASFAQRLDSLCQLEVREARHGDRVRPGLALIAPGGRHMTLKRSGAQYHVDVIDGPLINRHRPSVDVLFRSVALCAGKNALGVIMTGMGDDGARGLKEMREAGAYTLAQDEASCVVYGMPKEAVKLGAVERSLPLSSIAQAVLAHAPLRV
jgi:two-component system, chemotaxis family, protein-glutamate methylesterase/glutaminase